MDYRLLLTILIAYTLDLIFGDPQWRWHPVRLIGNLIERLEKRLNVASLNRVFSGIVLFISVVGVTIFCVGGILGLAEAIHPIFYYILSIFFIYFSLSVKALAVEANKVQESLKSGNILKARSDLSMIVGRDTERLDEPEIIRATVETVAESTMDGIVAPLFYCFLGGPVLMWAYKAINTLDSMVGYRSERFIEFGKPAAKIDALVNFIPARITSLLISTASWCMGKDWLRSLKWGLKYFFKGLEYNSEMTEAAMAGALGVRLGGLNFYNSKPCQKSLIGDNINPLDIRHIKESVKIMYISSVALALSVGAILLWLKKERV
ncbi:MAG: cobalamin biosynthesis protein CobD [Candidatus Omnitrophica bacterium]|nr:cobalamin biosynthesis protein CobD [Candidatus Omnitrophota bacterium]